MESILEAELERLGKSTMQAGEYVPPSGAMNRPFDLHALLIDPDGVGGDAAMGIHVSWTDRLVGDCNRDGMVTVSDLTPLGQFYEWAVDYRDAGETGGVEYWPQGTAMDLITAEQDITSQWQLACIDGNGDGLINLSDITPLGQHWQEQLTEYRFMIQRDGEPEPAVIMDPDNPGQELAVRFGESPLREMNGEEYWPDVPVYHEVTIRIDVAAGDRIMLVPVTQSGDRGDAHAVDVTWERPFWHLNGSPAAFAAFDHVYAVRVMQEGEAQGILVSAGECLVGDLDCNGVVHGLESALTSRYYNSMVDSLSEPGKSIAYRLDGNRDGQITLGDLGLVGATLQQRIDGIALFWFGDQPGQHVAIMNPDDPCRQLVLSRPLDVEFPGGNVYRRWLTDLPGEDRICISTVTSSYPSGTYSDPKAYEIMPGSVSSLPEDQEPVVAVVCTLYTTVTAGRDTSVCGGASYSNAGEITEYAWDLDGDGTYETVGEADILMTFTVGEHTVGLRVTDDKGNMAAAEWTFTAAE